MREAYSIKKQRLVKATESDYSDYYGFLLCPYCDDVVFLRKSCVWRNRTLNAVFVHHERTEISIECEKRSNSTKDSTALKAKYKSRDQQIEKLAFSLWKHLKTNQALDLKNWTHYYKSAMAKRRSFERITFSLDTSLVQIEKDNLWSVFEKSAQGVIRNTPFLKEMTPWKYTQHLNLTWPLLLLFLKSPRFKELRQRIYAIILSPSVLESLAIYPENEEHIEKFHMKVLSHILLSFNLTFITVDWGSILKK